MGEVGVRVWEDFPMCPCHDEPMYWHKRPNRKSGGNWICEVKRRKDQERRRKADPNKHALGQWASAIKKRYGVTKEQYEEMLSRQGGVCALCYLKCKTGKRLAIDHCHTTGRVRGLLCFNCNLAIGKAQENPTILRRMAQYLETQ